MRSIRSGNSGRILESLARAETLAESLDDRRRLGWISVLYGHYFWMVGDQDRALEFGQRVFGLAAALGISPSR